MISDGFRARVKFGIKVRGQDMVRVKGQDMVRVKGQDMVRVKGQDMVRVKGQDLGLGLKVPLLIQWLGVQTNICPRIFLFVHAL